MRTNKIISFKHMNINDAFHKLNNPSYNNSKVYISTIYTYLY